MPCIHGEGNGYPLQYSCLENSMDRGAWQATVHGLAKSWTFWGASLVAQMVKNPPAMQETQVWFLGQEDPLEKGTATHTSILAWRIPQTEKPGGLQSMGLQRVGHDWWLTLSHSQPSQGISQWLLPSLYTLPPLSKSGLWGSVSGSNSNPATSSWTTWVPSNQPSDSRHLLYTQFSHL